MSEIKMSIIIPSFNQGRYLKDTIQSIIDQNYENVEIIVMDGGSTDNSVDVIKSFEKYITYWQSQKDAGQSNAINNGIKRATGEFVTWLNSDDVLISGALTAVDKAIADNPECNFFLGNGIWMDKTGIIIHVGMVENDNAFWNKRHIFSNGGPSAFMRKSTLESIGMLREDFHYMMDTELWHRFIATGNPFKRIGQYLWGLRLHEDAKMSGHNFAGSKLADKSHPSWIQKRKEATFIQNEYPTNKTLFWVNRGLKLCSPEFYTRFTDKRLIGKPYNAI